MVKSPKIYVTLAGIDKKSGLMKNCIYLIINGI